jgi:hypothetical protein
MLRAAITLAHKGIAVFPVRAAVKATRYETRL